MEELKELFEKMLEMYDKKADEKKLDEETKKVISEQIDEGRAVVCCTNKGITLVGNKIDLLTALATTIEKFIKEFGVEEVIYVLKLVFEKNEMENNNEDILSIFKKVLEEME